MTNVRIKPKKNYLEYAYIQQEMTQKEIARKVGVCPRTVSKYICDYGLQKPNGQRNTLAKKLLTKEYLESVYPKMSGSEIARRLNLSQTVVSKYLIKYGMSIGFANNGKSEGSARGRLIISNNKTVKSGIKSVPAAKQSEYRIKPKQEWMKAAYLEQGYRQWEMGCAVGVSGSCINIWLKTYDMQLKQIEKDARVERNNARAARRLHEKLTGQKMLVGRMNYSVVAKYLYEKRHVENQSLQEIGKSMGINNYDIFTLFSRCNVPVQNPNITLGRKLNLREK